MKSWSKKSYEHHEHEMSMNIMTAVQQPVPVQVSYGTHGTHGTHGTLIIVLLQSIIYNKSHLVTKNQKPNMKLFNLATSDLFKFKLLETNL